MIKKEKIGTIEEAEAWVEKHLEKVANDSNDPNGVEYGKDAFVCGLMTAEDMVGTTVTTTVDSFLDVRDEIDDLWGEEGDLLGCCPWDGNCKEYKNPTVKITLGEFDYLEGWSASFWGWSGILDKDNYSALVAFCRWGGYTEPAFYSEWNERYFNFIRVYPKHERV